MNPISILWAKKIKSGERNYNEVPDQLKEEVEQKLLEDGFTIDENGCVVRV